MKVGDLVKPKLNVNWLDNVKAIFLENPDKLYKVTSTDLEDLSMYIGDTEGHYIDGISNWYFNKRDFILAKSFLEEKREELIYDPSGLHEMLSN